MTHVNTAHRGARIAAALVAVILGATACGSDDNDSSSATDVNIAEPGKTDAPSVNGDARSGGAGRHRSPVPTSRHFGGDARPGPWRSTCPMSSLHRTSTWRSTSATASRSTTSARGSTMSLRCPTGTAARSTNARSTSPTIDRRGIVRDQAAAGERRGGDRGSRRDRRATHGVAGHRGRHQSGGRHRRQLVTAQASLDRVRKLLEAATDLGQILSLESQLTERETLVEQYTAMKRALSDRVSLATLASAVEPQPRADRRRRSSSRSQPEKPTIAKAFKSGWNGFVTVLAAIMIFIGYTAPFLVLAAIAAAVLIPISRRRRSASPAERTKSISCSTAPTSSGRRSANVRTRFRRRGQKSVRDDAERGAHALLPLDRAGTSGHASRPITCGRTPAHTSTNGWPVTSTSGPATWRRSVPPSTRRRGGRRGCRAAAAVTARTRRPSRPVRRCRASARRRSPARAGRRPTRARAARRRACPRPRSGWPVRPAPAATGPATEPLLVTRRRLRRPLTRAHQRDRLAVEQEPAGL